MITIGILKMKNKIKLSPKDMKAGDILCLNGKMIESVVYNIWDDFYKVICYSNPTICLCLYPDEELYVLREEQGD